MNKDTDVYVFFTDRTIDDAIIEYEEGELTPKEEVELFAALIATGLAWQLQGMYGRMAREFIAAGIISNNGKIHWDKFKELLGERHG